MKFYQLFSVPDYIPNDRGYKVDEMMNATWAKRKHKFMVDVAVALGANRTKAEKEFRDVLKLQIQIHKVCNSY